MVSTQAEWWVFPVVVTGCFAFVQQVDALFITPKIVGERVGLHPLTVIFSVFLWSLLLGGLLGAILASFACGSRAAGSAQACDANGGRVSTARDIGDHDDRSSGNNRDT